MDTPSSIFIQQWHDGDRRALEKVLERHLPWIQSYVHRKISSLLRSKTETGDIVQDAVVRDGRVEELLVATKAGLARVAGRIFIDIHHPVVVFAQCKSRQVSDPDVRLPQGCHELSIFAQ